MNMRPLLQAYLNCGIRLSFRLAATSDLFETLPVDCPDESSILTYNCNFKGNGCRQR